MALSHCGPACPLVKVSAGMALSCTPKSGGMEVGLALSASPSGICTMGLSGVSAVNWLALPLSLLAPQAATNRAATTSRELSVINGLCWRVIYHLTSDWLAAGNEPPYSNKTAARSL